MPNAASMARADSRSASPSRVSASCRRPVSISAATVPEPPLQGSSRLDVLGGPTVPSSATAQPACRASASTVRTRSRAWPIVSAASRASAAAITSARHICRSSSMAGEIASRAARAAAPVQPFGRRAPSAMSADACNRPAAASHSPPRSVSSSGCQAIAWATPGRVIGAPDGRRPPDQRIPAHQPCGGPRSPSPGLSRPVCARQRRRDGVHPGDREPSRASRPPRVSPRPSNRLRHPRRGR